MAATHQNSKSIKIVSKSHQLFLTTTLCALYNSPILPYLQNISLSSTTNLSSTKESPKNHDSLGIAVKGRLEQHDGRQDGDKRLKNHPCESFVARRYLPIRCTLSLHHIWGQQAISLRKNAAPYNQETTVT